MGALPCKTNRNYMRREPYRANKDIIAVLRVTRCAAFLLWKYSFYQCFINNLVGKRD